MSATDIGSVDEFVNCQTAIRRVEGQNIVVVRVDDEFFALEDRCSHEEFPLSAGELDCEKREIECERHGAMFSLSDGAAVSFPATKAVRAFAISVRDGRVEVEL